MFSFDVFVVIFLSVAQVVLRPHTISAVKSNFSVWKYCQAAFSLSALD